MLGHVCVGLIDSDFERRIALWSHGGQEVMGEVWRRGEGWKALWCAEIDNIKKPLTKTQRGQCPASPDISLGKYKVQIVACGFYGRYDFRNCEPIVRGLHNPGCHFFFFFFYSVNIHCVHACFSPPVRDGTSSISVLIKMHHMAQPDIHRYSQNIKQEKKKSVSGPWMPPIDGVMSILSTEGL